MMASEETRMRPAKLPGSNPGFRRGSVLWFGALLSLPFALLAQTTGMVDGVVTDQSNTPLPGVSVELAGPRLQGVRTTVTTANGVYRFPSVPPGAYTITASLPGLGKVEKKATVTLDATASVTLQLTMTASAEVTVTGQAPIVDTTSTTTGSSYSAKVIDKLPLDRNYAEVVFLQPGTQADFGDTQGRSLGISLYGSTSSENLFLIDGINTNNVLKGMQGKDINSEFIEDVEVKAGGYQAEYGRNTGAVINVITKSGGNEFHGGVFGYYNDTGMRAEPQNGLPPNYDTPQYSQTGDAQFFNYVDSKNVRQEWGMDLGGFLWKDRIWFFGAYNRVQVNQTLQTLDPTNAETFGVQFPNSYVENKYAGKITLNLAQSTTLVGSYFSDAQTQNGVILPPPTSLIAPSYAGRRDTGGPDYGARLNQLFGASGLLSLQYGRHADRYATTPIDPNLQAISDLTVSTSGSYYSSIAGFGQIFGPIDNNHSQREAYVGSFSAYAGNMEIKIGGDYTHESTAGSSYFTGGERLRIRPCLQDGGLNQCDLSRAPIYNNGQPQTLPDGSPNPAYFNGPVFYQHNFYASGTPKDPTLVPAVPFSGGTKRYCGYVQDQWRVIPTLTVNLGLRYDSETYYGDQDPATGRRFKAFSLTNQWAPRLGFTWDFVGDGSSKLYGSIGRFYYAIPTDLNVRVYTASSFAITFNYDPTSIVQDEAAPRNTNFIVGTLLGEPSDRGLKESYEDEATLGVEKALGPSLSIGLKGTYRSLGRTVEDRCDLNYATNPFNNSCGLANPGSSGPVASGYYPTCNGSGNPTDPTSGTCTTTYGSGHPMGTARRYFRGIELMAREQFSNELWAQASFLYSSLEGNYSGAVREATGQTDPGINADFDYYQFENNAFGRLELDRPVQFRLDASYTASFGLSAGLGFYVRSGRPTDQLGYFNQFYTTDLYVTTRGTAGRLPTDYDLNLSLAYDLSVGPVTVTPIIAVLNLLNRQTPNNVDQFFNPNGAFVTDLHSPFYGQAGVEPGTGSCPASASAPCSDNPDYRKITQRINPRLLRVALKITF
jgi:outer membrane receptor protein involved in Fe transport